MGVLTETEIFSCLRENFKLASEHCELLAKIPRKGPTYRLLREELKLIEGCCRQIAHWRQDTGWRDGESPDKPAGWLRIGMQMAQAHESAGTWLRGVKFGRGPRRPLPPGKMHPMFMALAAALRALAVNTEILRMNRTGRVGVIVPPFANLARNVSHSAVALPPGMSRSPGGLLIPSGVAVQ